MKMTKCTAFYLKIEAKTEKNRKLKVAKTLKL